MKPLYPQGVYFLKKTEGINLQGEKPMWYKDMDN